MKKNLMIGLLALSLSVVSYSADIYVGKLYAQTKDRVSSGAWEIINKNPSSYTAGTGSVYGSQLSQEQLYDVAEVVAAFKVVHITDDMDDRQKIQEANDYLKEICSYAEDWSVNYANTAWGAFSGKAQCSGYARAFKALCDGIGIDCYYVHANSAASNPEHQWNIVKADGIWYHIDVQANDSFIMDVTFLSTVAPDTYNESEYPTIGVVEKEYVPVTNNNAMTEEEALQMGFSLTTSPGARTLPHGVYKVGTDIPKGTYVLCDLEECSYFYVSDTSMDTYIGYDSIVTLKEGELLEISGSCTITPIREFKDIDYRKGEMFLVGYHIPVGRYRLRSQEGNSGYYEICSNARPEARERIIPGENGFFQGAKDIKLYDGQYLRIVWCDIEKVIDPKKLNKE